MRLWIFKDDCYFWGVIHRILQETAEKALQRSPSIAILGPRQVGKTTLAKAIAQSKEGAIYVDMENPRDRQKLEDSYSYLAPQQETCVIIDEVQLMPELFSVLRPLIDENRVPGRFILLGSASPSLVKGVSESLAGRITYLELAGFSLDELPAGYDYRQHWFRGGFPNALLAKNDEESKEWLDDFIRSYVERDLGHLFGTGLSPVTLRNFWSMLAHTNGGVWNAETFARSLGITAPTVLRYLSFLEGGYLARRLQPWFVNAKKRLVKSPKVYIRDTGIVHRMLGIPDYDALLGHPGVGGSWEGYVIEQVYQQKPRDIDLFYYRTQAGAECDLVLVKGIAPIACIEIKLSNTPVVSKGFLSCCDDLQPAYKYIITPESENFTTPHGVQVTGLRNFVTQVLPQIK